MSEDVQVTKGAFVNKIILTDKSLSEAFIFASINSQYDNRLFMELPWKIQAWFAEKVRGVIFSFLSLWLQFSIENVLIGIFVEQ